MMAEKGMKVSRILLLTILTAFFFYSQPVSANASRNEAINNQLKQELSEQQSLADSDPGNYDYAKYLHQVTYQRKATIVIKVNPGFNKMTKQDRNHIMKQAVALTEMIVKHNRPSKADSLTFKVIQNKQEIGIKKPQQRSFHW